MAREGRGLRGMMMADNNANTLAWGREQIPSPEINANVMMIRDRGTCSALENREWGLNYFLQFIIQFSIRGEKKICVPRECQKWASAGALFLGVPDKLCFKTLTLQFVFISGTGDRWRAGYGAISRPAARFRTRLLAPVIRWRVVRVSYNALCSKQCDPDNNWRGLRIYYC